MPKQSFSILFTASECTPFVKIGGLGDVIGSLPQALAKEGVKVSVMLPEYSFIRKNWKSKLRTVAHGTTIVHHNRKKERIGVSTLKLPGNPVTYYFLSHPLFSVKNPYTKAQKNERFILFSKAVVEAVHQTKLPCDIIHAHDWHTAWVPTFIDTLSVEKRYRNIPSVFTIHNLNYQGSTARSVIQHFELPKDSTPSLFEDYYDIDGAALNAMKLGILSANLVTTVSPSYAQEILSPEHGDGLETFLSRRKKHLIGIVNGIDTTIFNPARDAALSKIYTAKTVRLGKEVNKKSLQRELRLPSSKAPLFSIVSRLTTQKGIDILAQALPMFLQNDLQVAILGSGDKILERSLQKLAKQFPKKLSITLGFNEKLAHKIYAASDFFIMPSLFEPCGLGQMIAMRYGTVPLVRKTGGLQDTVQNNKTGIVFKEYSAQALSEALLRALKLYDNKRAWYTMINRCMKENFSWNRSAKEYVKIYNQLV